MNRELADVQAEPVDPALLVDLDSEDESEPTKTTGDKFAVGDSVTLIKRSDKAWRGKEGTYLCVQVTGCHYAGAATR